MYGSQGSVKIRKFSGIQKDGRKNGKKRDFSTTLELWDKDNSGKRNKCGGN